MENFPAKYFRFTTQYPESGVRVQLGRSYQFDAPPEAPDQRIFTLKLLGMAYFVDENGLDLATSTGRNLGVLEAFYNRHKTAKSFLLEHPLYGQVECKFNRPLAISEGIAGGDGLVADLEVELIEIP